MALDNLQLFRISPTQMVYSAGGDIDPQRFLSDVNYVGRYAAGIAECLGARTIDHALIEDAFSQTAFYYATSPDGIGAVVNGIFTRSPQPPGELLDRLSEE